MIRIDLIMIQEHKNMVREIFRCVLFYAKPTDHGYNSKFALAFTEDEHKTIRKIFDEMSDL